MRYFLCRKPEAFQCLQCMSGDNIYAPSESQLLRRFFFRVPVTRWHTLKKAYLKKHVNHRKDISLRIFCCQRCSISSTYSQAVMTVLWLLGKTWTSWENFLFVVKMQLRCFGVLSFSLGRRLWNKNRKIVPLSFLSMPHCRHV